MSVSRPLNLAILSILVGLLYLSACTCAPSVSAHHLGLRLKKWYEWNNDMEITKKWYDWQNVPHALQQKRQPFETSDYIIE
ncbi:uncharacterized protein CELE_Y58G8A.5 [Caenorhabditis elegans]|uniref:Secreted protein n=1 Tax=Caenorhabditis elegans TaxID=6239 RepID=Q4R173_CAEEL|nr:Secreted protein [Caenorhabditis elegans]CCD70461.1 Secreted protein [Caenorhabditis elegans]|eukprot:NP_001033517.1 Neuropeptide-Like Protein [Caenorhabditis elegans]